ncbi:uncharacterized protein Triagg1_2405 [Trichoderma aggressivum f. europaeum]|uniref:FHA domain-containing protein n=1 Tax=Trichoderma aggressivum f. europaeum TaxID=173218 RepID=A0AAE1IGZ1_9HYPO|nr:hypothetical protein Triagg1_2405 [Trichoderma aggressivum f. europaeum]
MPVTSEGEDLLYNLAYECEGLFYQLQEAFQKTQSEVATAQLCAEFQQRFAVWAAHLGVFARKSQCLDTRLQNHPDLQDLVARLLDVLRRSLQQCTADTSSQGEGEGVPTAALKSIDDTLTRLNRLGVTIRQSGRGKFDARAKKFAAGLDLSSFAFLCANAVQALYPGAHQSLKDYLSKSMTDRYARMLFFGSRHKKLETRRERRIGLSPIHEVPNKETQSSNPVVRLPMMPKNPVLAHLLRPSAAPSLSDLSSVNMYQIRNRLRPPDEASTRFHKTSSIQVNQGNYPRLPATDKGSSIFTCHWCSEPLSKKTLSESEWRQHIDRDLKPYICLSEGCTEAHPAYPTFDEWFTHMELHDSRWHQQIYLTSSWVCTVCEFNQDVYSSPQALYSHLEESHGSDFTNAQLQAISRQSKTEEPRASDDCLLCCFEVQEKGNTGEPMFPKRRKGQPKQEASKSARKTLEMTSPNSHGPDLDLSDTSSDSDDMSSHQNKRQRNKDRSKAVARHVAVHLQVLMLLTLRFAAALQHDDEDLDDGAKSDSVNIDEGNSASIGGTDLGKLSHIDSEADVVMKDGEDGNDGKQAEGVMELDEDMDNDIADASIPVPDTDLDLDFVPRQYDDLEAKDDEFLNTVIESGAYQSWRSDLVGISDIICVLYPHSEIAGNEVQQLAMNGSPYIISKNEVDSFGKDEVDSFIANKDLEDHPSLFEPDTTSHGDHAILLRLSSQTKNPAAGFSFGRHPLRCDVAFVNDPLRRISNIHFRIYVTKYGMVMIEDMSTNGTFINQNLLTFHSKSSEKRPISQGLSSGDIISLRLPDGSNDLSFRVQIPHRDDEQEEAYAHRVEKYLAPYASQAEVVTGRGSSPSGTDIVLEAAKSYRESMMAQKNASDEISSRKHSPDESVVDRWQQSADQVVAIDTPPDEDAKEEYKSPYDNSNADVRMNNEIHPEDIQRIEVAHKGTDAPPFGSRDPSCERDQPMLNTPVGSPVPKSPQPSNEDAEKPEAIFKTIEVQLNSYVTQLHISMLSHGLGKCWEALSLLQRDFYSFSRRQVKDGINNNQIHFRSLSNLHEDLLSTLVDLRRLLQTEDRIPLAYSLAFCEKIAAYRTHLAALKSQILEEQEAEPFSQSDIEAVPLEALQVTDQHYRNGVRILVRPLPGLPDLRLNSGNSDKWLALRADGASPDSPKHKVLAITQDLIDAKCTIRIPESIGDDLSRPPLWCELYSLSPARDSIAFWNKSDVPVSLSRMSHASSSLSLNEHYIVKPGLPKSLGLGTFRVEMELENDDVALMDIRILGKRPTAAKPAVYGDTLASQDESPEETIKREDESIVESIEREEDFSPQLKRVGHVDFDNLAKANAETEKGQPVLPPIPQAPPPVLISGEPTIRKAHPVAMVYSGHRARDGEEEKDMEAPPHPRREKRRPIDKNEDEEEAQRQRLRQRMDRRRPIIVDESSHQMVDKYAEGDMRAPHPRREQRRPIIVDESSHQMVDKYAEGDMRAPHPRREQRRPIIVDESSHRARKEEEDEEEAQRRRLRQRMSDRSRSNTRRHRVSYDDGVYRWE